jgi:hypothetical protein
MADKKPYANQHLWEWWLNDYVNSTVTVMSRSDRYKFSQQIVDDWGAHRRKLLSWSDKITEGGIENA